MGIEDTVLNSNPEYSTLDTELNRVNIEELGYTDFKDLIEKESCSIQNDTIKEVIKDKNSENLMDRKFSELLQIEVDPLPEGLKTVILYKTRSY